MISQIFNSQQIKKGQGVLWTMIYIVATLTHSEFIRVDIYPNNPWGPSSLTAHYRR